jgi:hypothetical protein
MYTFKHMYQECIFSALIAHKTSRRRELGEGRRESDNIERERKREIWVSRHSVYLRLYKYEAKTMILH